MSSSSTSLDFLRTFMSKSRSATIFGQFLPNRLSSIFQKSQYSSSSKSKESLSCDLRTKVQALDKDFVSETTSDLNELNVGEVTEHVEETPTY